jgi:L-ascorbate metabolism protein UlaG (beta-lactamase superfamily)
MALAVTYLGGPTVLLEYAGLTIVTDPTFDPPRAYDDGDGSPPLLKTAGPGIERTDLPPVDLVLLSHHEHEDNLDYEGLELLATGVRTYSTMKAAGDLFGGGVVGLDPWESDEFNGVTVTAVPALHGPPGSERRLGPVTGFVLEAPGQPAVYVSGDNASIPLVEQIAERFPSIGVAVLFAGAAQYGDLPGPLTLSSADAVRAAAILGAPLIATPRGERVEL